MESISLYFPSLAFFPALNQVALNFGWFYNYKCICSGKCLSFIPMKRTSIQAHVKSNSKCYPKTLLYHDLDLKQQEYINYGTNVADAIKQITSADDFVSACMFFASEND